MFVNVDYLIKQVLKFVVFVIYFYTEQLRRRRQITINYFFIQFFSESALEKITRQTYDFSYSQLSNVQEKT